VKEAKNTTEALIKSTEEKNKNFDRNGSIISSNPWVSLVSIQPKGSNPPLFCISAVGGNVLNYFNLVPYLGTNQPVYGLQSQGLDGISKPFQDIETIAAHYIKEIRTLQCHGSYYLCGGSFGGTVAFEMAQQLKREGEDIALLVMFDTIGPNYLESIGSNYKKDKSRLIHFLDNISFRINEIRALKPKGKILYIRNYVTDKLLNRFYWIPCLLYRMLRRPIPHHLRYFYIEQVNIKALRKYKPGKLSGKFTLFRCPTQPEGIYSDPMQGWKGMTTEDIKIIEIPGTHRNFVEEPMLGKQLDLSLQEIHSTINK
jgi:aspartate racemase